MNELGHILREARETKGYTLEDVQEEIRINAKYLKSLENGDYNALPTPVHVRGFCAIMLVSWGWIRSRC